MRKLLSLLYFNTFGFRLTYQVMAYLMPFHTPIVDRANYEKDQCFSKWAESPPWGRFWWAKGRNNTKGGKMLDH